MTDKTTFQSAVWQVVAGIKPGDCMSYAQVARCSGFPGYARHVSKALQSAPHDLPWHRVVRADGRLGFADGSAAAVRQLQLLEQDGVDTTNLQLELKKRLKRVDTKLATNHRLDKWLWGTPPET